MAYTVFSFFAEGGTRAYVVRVSASDSATATTTLNGSGTAAPALTFSALSEGDWGNRLGVNIGQCSDPDLAAADYFKLTVQYTELNLAEVSAGRTVTEEEVYDNVSAKDIEAALNGVSKYISVSFVGDSAETLANLRPADSADAVTYTALSAGADGTSAISAAEYLGTEANQKGLHALDVIDDINIVAIPEAAAMSDATVARNTTLGGLDYCETFRQDCFFVADSLKGMSVQDISDYKHATGTFSSGNAMNVSRGAIYYPWVKVIDPLTNGTKLVPPSGVIAGTYAATDSNRGVHKAPAGVADGFLGSVLESKNRLPKANRTV